VAAAPVLGEDIKYASYGEVLRAYEAQSQELANLRTRLAALESHSYAGGENGQANGCSGLSCGTGCCCDPCSPGFIFGAELLFIKPFAGTGMAAANRSFMWEFDYEASPRFWVGYAFANCLGVRLRYWDYDQSTTSNLWADGFVEGVTGTLRLNVAVIDAEVFDTTPLGLNWQATASAGYRYMDYQTEYSVREQGEVTQVGRVLSGLHGVTAALELRRNFPGRYLGLFGNVRTSWLFGDESMYSITPNGTERYWARDVGHLMLETQLGIDWNRPIANDAAILFTRLGVEAQWWSDMEGFINSNSRSAIGLFGLMCAVGISR
jgi:hypothetical protein